MSLSSRKLAALWSGEGGRGARFPLTGSTDPTDARLAVPSNRRWAAKEAVYKAIGGYRLLFPEIEVVAAAAAASDEVVRMPQPLVTLPPSGFGPRIKLHGASLAAAEAMGVKKVLLSLSHDASTIFAVAAALEAHGRS